MKNQCYTTETVVTKDDLLFAKCSCTAGGHADQKAVCVHTLVKSGRTPLRNRLFRPRHTFAFVGTLGTKRYHISEKLLPYMAKNEQYGNKMQYGNPKVVVW